MLKIQAWAVGDYQVNTILVWCERTRKAALFDPSAEAELLIEEIERRELTLDYLINTHGHLDHIAENAAIKRHFNVPLLIHEQDRPMLTDALKNMSAYTGENVISPDADRTLQEGDVVRVGDEELKVLHVPGHTPGSLVFYHPGFLISGDTLFQSGVGRTDFPGGSEEQLLDNIRRKLYTLPEDTIVYPGHGPTTTIGEERRTNPFIRA